MGSIERNRKIYNNIAQLSSKIITRKYSTSFSLSIYLLDKSIRKDIYAIYGFVRLADEIVDTFLDAKRNKLLANFKSQTYQAINDELSLNPVLHNFQSTVHLHSIDRELIDAFFQSMEMDLTHNEYNRVQYETYIYGSAEVVGLMCLKVFCKGDEKNYKTLKPYAERLGAAFQKVNFLRDINQDKHELKRYYFPQLQDGKLTHSAKKDIEIEIEEDFKIAYEGVLNLPSTARFGVYVAYVYYYCLFNKIKKAPPGEIENKRLRVSNLKKCQLLIMAALKHSIK